MLVLFETSGGYALFKVNDTKKLKDEDALVKAFSDPATATELVSLKHFRKFENTAEALKAALAINDGKLDKTLKKFLKSHVTDGVHLAVQDTKIGNLIKEKLDVKCIFDDSVMELMRGIRSQLDALVAGMSESDRQAMTLGLSHTLARYKLKFSPDKVDTMIIQAIALLDELDKELNTYAMRVREWYGWHFPEMGKLIPDNIAYAKVVMKMGVRTNCKSTDFSDILPEEMEKDVKDAAEVSMGTEVTEEDIANIKELCDQVIEISAYRGSLYEYLQNRMQAIAPNLTVMVGELVGARLIAHAGSLINLAKQPASTVQILGAEKALFRALKTKSETPKYGLIYHASLVGQAAPKHKGKISRVLAAKTALSVRADALGDSEGATVAFGGREHVERRLQELETGVVSRISGTSKSKAKQEKYVKPENTRVYNDAADVTNDVEMGDSTTTTTTPSKKKKKKKRSHSETDNTVIEDAPATAPASKKVKTNGEESTTTTTTVADETMGEPSPKKDKKKKKKKKTRHEE